MAPAYPAPVPLRISIDYRPALLGKAGIARAVRELARSLSDVASAQDLDLHLFGHCLSAAIDDTPPPARLHRLPLPGRLQPWLARMGLDAARLSGCPGVFHWTDTVHPPIRHTKVLLTVHDVAFAEDTGFHGPAALGLQARCRAAVAQAAAIVTPTRATALALEEHFHPTVPVHVIPFGADHLLQRAVPGGPRPVPRRPFLLCLGTIEPRKNHLRLLAAYRNLPTPRPDLVVVGRAGWCCDEIVAALRAAVGSGVHWLADASDQQVTLLLASALAMVYPSQLEGFGFPPLEAMAVGTPVVAGDTPALREVLGTAALFVDPLDVEAITEGLRLIVHDENTARRLRNEGPARAATFRWLDCATAHARLYHEIAGG